MNWIYSSERRQQIFKDYVAGFFNELASSKRPALDVVTRWNSTYVMLMSTIPYREVFERLAYRDSSFGPIAPLDEEWEQAISLCDFLKPFYDSKQY